MTIDPSSLCPCESGTPFGQCHGAHAPVPAAEPGADGVDNRILDERGTAAAVRGLVASALAALRSPAAMTNLHSWVSLTELLGEPMTVDVLISNVRRLDRRHTFLKLAHLASVLANSPGSVMGEQARAWTRDLLVERRDSTNPLEAAIGRALAALPAERAVAHAHVVFLLQVLALVHGCVEGKFPHDGYLALLMLAGNDHIPEWTPDNRILTDIEQVLAPAFLCTSFNRSNDLVRTLLRTVDIIGHRSMRAYPDAAGWDQVQREAFGTSFEEYVELFLVPLLTLSRSWGLEPERGPSFHIQQWRGRDEREQVLYRRWISEASITLDEARTTFASRVMPSGMPGLPPAFFRHPFVRLGDHLVCISPWHIRDHAIYGTWAKLNTASKTVLKTDSNQVFSSAFGDSFETWCGAVVREASSVGGFQQALLLPSSPGADDEIEDVVLHEGEVVVLLSSKASLVPETSLKTAERMADVVEWLERFFFEDRGAARKRGYRGGAALLLDQKVQKLREGQFEHQGLRRDALVLPCIVSFDNVGESGILYRWLEEECHRRGILSARPRVRPLTILTPEDYEGLMALGADGRSVCRLLVEKTEPQHAWGPLDQFLYERAPGTKLMRLPSMKTRFDDLVTRSVTRMKEAHDALVALPATGAERFDPSGEPVLATREGIGDR